MRSIFAMFRARFREFYRDKASLGWNFVFPFFIIFAFYFAFSDDKQDVFTVGVISEAPLNELDLSLLKTKHITFKTVAREEGMKKVRRHSLDLLIHPQPEQVLYWVNSSSRNGYFVEKILRAESQKSLRRQTVEGKEIRYLDWVFPGIIAMNIMFNCLWGVGYSVVKYRQDGYLKRLKATPVKAYQFLLSQILARYVIAFVVTSIVYFGSQWSLGFAMNGSYFDLVLIFTAGISALMSIGLLVASRTTSKEFADGILNLASWPMMFLSGVWFSLENASDGLKQFADFLPLTHMINGMRSIMVDGASIIELRYEMLFLTVFSVALITLSSLMFKWTAD